MINIYNKHTIIDIETIPSKEYSKLTQKDKEIFAKWNKSNIKKAEENHTGKTNEGILEIVYNENAALHPEFGRVICVSVCNYHREGTTDNFISKIGENEVEILESISRIINNEALIGHNMLDFDIPFLIKRLIINGLPLPNSLNIAEKKPWEIIHKDTMKLWKGGFGGKNISLDHLCHFLGVQSPKADVNGSHVHEMAKNGNLSKIAEYCEGDIKAVADVLNVLRGIA